MGHVDSKTKKKKLFQCWSPSLFSKIWGQLRSVDINLPLCLLSKPLLIWHMLDWSVMRKSNSLVVSYGAANSEAIKWSSECVRLLLQTKPDYTYCSGWSQTYWVNYQILFLCFILENDRNPIKWLSGALTKAQLNCAWKNMLTSLAFKAHGNCYFTFKSNF